MHYRARTAASAHPAKRGPSSTSKAGRRQARAAARRGGKLPTPGSLAARRRYASFIPNTEEARFLQRAARSFTLDRRSTGPNPYELELRELGERAYRAAYNAQSRERRPARAKAARAKEWTWVKRHRRKLRR